jgi:hypothetical protein
MTAPGALQPGASHVRGNVGYLTVFPALAFMPQKRRQPGPRLARGRSSPAFRQRCGTRETFREYNEMLCTSSPRTYAEHGRASSWSIQEIVVDNRFYKINRFYLSLILCYGTA